MEIMKHVMLFHWSVHKVLIYVKLMTYVYIYIVHVIESIDILCQTFRKPFDSVVSRGDVMFNHGQRSAQPNPWRCQRWGWLVLNQRGDDTPLKINMEHTLPETNSSPLRMDGWKTIVSF